MERTPQSESAQSPGAVIKWLARHQRFHLHFIPTSSSWLNQVERWFRDLTERNLRRGIFGSVPDLITSIETYLEAHNDDPKPYVWTATAEDILTKVQRARTHLDAPVNQNRDTPLGAHGLLVVDLTQVTFIDACCTGLLLGGSVPTADPRGGRIPDR